MRKNLSKYIKKNVYDKIIYPKEININSKDILNITFSDKIIITKKTNKIIKFHQNDKLFIDEKKINLFLFHDIYLKTHKKSIEKYNKIHKDICFIDFHIPLYFDHKDGATAEYNYFKPKPKYRVPFKININLNSLFNLDEYKFSLGHEFGHFIEYLDIKNLTNFQKLQRHILDFFLFLIKFTFLTLCLLASAKIKSKEPSFDLVTNILCSIFFVISFLLLLEEIISSLHITMYRNEFYKKHQEEFLCDKYSYDIFKKEIDLNKTFLKEEKSKIKDFLTYHSHPSHFNRRKFLLKKKITLNPLLIKSVIVKNDYEYEDTLKLCSDAFNDLKKYLESILEKINKKGYKLTYEKANNKNN